MDATHEGLEFRRDVFSAWLMLLSLAGHYSFPSIPFPPKAKAFYTWLDHVQWRKRMRVVMDRTAKRMRNSGLARAWDAWRSAVENSKIDFHMTKKEELAVRNLGPILPIRCHILLI